MSHLRVLQVITIAIITLLASYGANDRTDTGTGDAPPRNGSPVVAATEVEWCAGIGDVFQLDVPGTYAAFAIGSSGSLVTDVRGNHGELLATSNQTTATTAAVDLPSGLRFGVAAPQVFEVESSVLIQVQHDSSPYELILVRVDGSMAFSDLNVRPPVEQIINESGSCLIGDLREIFEIHTEAVYSDNGARQVFLVDSPIHLVTGVDEGESLDRDAQAVAAARS